MFNLSNLSKHYIALHAIKIFKRTYFFFTIQFGIFALYLFIITYNLSTANQRYAFNGRSKMVKLYTNDTYIKMHVFQIDL